MKILRNVCLGVIGMGLAVSCIDKQDNNAAEDARILYTRSIGLATKYTDSILQSKDSATVFRLIAAYEESLTKLNYGFPPDSDYAMDECMNDTLINLNDRFIHARDSMLYFFAHRPVATDSIQSDSIAVLVKDTIP